MQKVFTPKFVMVLVISIACLYLTLPTFKYFAHVIGMDETPSQEQIDRRNDLLAGGSLIKLGLDLQGGADFLLSIDVDTMVRRNLENEAEVIRQSLARPLDIASNVRLDFENPDDMAIVVSIDNQRDLDLAVQTLNDHIDRSGQSLEARTPVRESLAQGELRLGIPPDGLRVSVEEAMDGALRVVRRRVDEFGLTQPIVTRSGRDRIRVQIPGETNPERIRESLLKTASLEFRLLHPQHDSLIQEYIVGGAQGMVSLARTGIIKDEFLEAYQDPDTPSKTLYRLKGNIPNIPAGYTLRLGSHSEHDPATGAAIPENTFENLVYMVRAEAPLVGADLRRATAITDPADFRDPIKVSMEFKPDAAGRFCQLTTDNEGQRFAIILDDHITSAPNINEPICGGSAQISGGFTQIEARDLATVLRAGALPAPLRVIEENTVGASLGADSIRDSGKAVAIGAVLIIILMVSIYGTCGVVSILAMLLNLLMILAVLSLMSATLTLSGIGGILLTMGMAVDANILIYERLREELDTGKPLRAAINAAFGKAFSVIVDSNITSILPALVLVLFEVVDGSMKGFWTALAIGLLANLYTGIVVTRVLIEAWYAEFKTVSVGKIRLLHGVKFSWMKYRMAGIAFSLGLTVLCAGYLAVRGVNLGIDFTGGVLSTVSVPDTTGADRTKLLGLFTEDYSDARVIRIVNQDKWQVTLPQNVDPETEERRTLDSMRADLTEKLQQGFPNATIESVQSVDPVVGGEFRIVAFASLLVVAFVILGYLAVRFQWIFGAGAILALVHDVFLSLGLFKLMGFSLTLDIVSALLIILGYSVNDTIVVFDRVREKMHERHSGNLMEIFDTAINETLSRTVLTSGTTFMAVLTLYLFGGAALKDFALILLFGIFFGSYSSIFIGSGLVYAYLHKKGITTVMAARKATARVALPKEKPVKQQQ